MREYELTVVYDLAVQEAGGPDASPQHLTQMVESRGGKMLNIDHWGRRRLAYPIGRAIDADYIVSRIEIDPAGVTGLEAALGIDERVFRHLIMRADELPVPPPPREPRRQPGAEVPAPAPVAEAVAAPVEEAAPVVAESAAPETPSSDYTADAATTTEVAPAAPADEAAPVVAESAAPETPSSDYTADAATTTEVAPAAPADEAPAVEPQA